MFCLNTINLFVQLCVRGMCFRPRIIILLLNATSFYRANMYLFLCDHTVYIAILKVLSLCHSLLLISLRRTLPGVFGCGEALYRLVLRIVFVCVYVYK